MARTASSTILIKASSTTVAGSQEIFLFYGKGFSDPSKRILSTETLTVEQLENTGICIPGNIVPITEGWITVVIGGECNLQPEYIQIDFTPITPTPTPTPTSTPSPVTSTPTPTPTLTSTPVPPPIGQKFNEDYIFIRSNIPDQGRLVWYTSFSTDALNFIKALAGLTFNPIQGQSYTVKQEYKDNDLEMYTYSNGINTLYNKINFGSNSTVRWSSNGGQVTVTIENVVATGASSITELGKYYNL